MKKNICNLKGGTYAVSYTHLCFAQRLRELRKENGITQAGLAERMNVSRTCIANWESGKRIPEVAAITYLAKLFKVPVDYLCGRTDERCV